MKKFTYLLQQNYRSSVSKKSCWKGENVDVLSRWTADPPPGDRIIDGSVTGCRIQGRRDMFGGTCTHSPEWQEGGTTTNINFNNSSADDFSLEVTSTDGLAQSILVNASPVQDDGLVPRQTSAVNLRIPSGRSLDRGVNLNTNDATLSKNIRCLPMPTVRSRINIRTSAFNHVGRPGRSPRRPMFDTQNECRKFRADEPSNSFGQTSSSPMADPTPVKNVTRQGMTTDEARAFHQVKARIHAVTEVINDATKEFAKLLEVWKKGTQQWRESWSVWMEEEDLLNKDLSELIKECAKLNAKGSRLLEKENDARISQPHFQRKKDRHVKKAQRVLLKREALEKRQQENDQRRQEIDKKDQENGEIKKEIDEIQQGIEWMQKEIEEEFPYLSRWRLEVKENAEHPMPQVEQPTSVASPVRLLGQAVPSTHFKNKANVECPVPHEVKPKVSARRPVLPVNHDLSNTQVEIEEDAKRRVNQVERPFKSASSPGCLDEKILPGVDEHHFTEEGSAPSLAQEEKWVVVSSRNKTKVPKKSDKARHRPAVDNAQRKKSINQERPRSQEKESEAKCVADLDEAFLLEYPFLTYMMTGHTTGCPDSAPAPNRAPPRHVRKAPKRSAKAPRRPVVPSSSTPKWKGSKFKQHVGNNTKNRRKAYRKTSTTSRLDRCWALPLGRARRQLK